jgi:predicted dehydrogenase
MVEKPMVTNSDDARKLVRFAKAKKLDLQIAIQGTYTDTFAYARKLISDGTIGPLQLATGILGQGWMNGTRGMWRQNPKLSGGGQLYDSTAHVLSAMMFLVNSPAVEVFCWADNKGTKVDINAVGTIRFANGCMATITSGGNCPTWFSHLILQGAGAIMEISPHGGSFRVHNNTLKKEIKTVPARWKIRSVSPARNFADVILGKDEPRCSGQLGIVLADLMDGFYRSAKTGKPTRI